MQLSCACKFWYLPAAQSRQLVRTPAVSYCPAAQFRQALCPAVGWYLPPGHCRHAELGPDPAFPLYRPAEQLMQPVEAVLGWYCPAEQSMQDAWAVLLLYCPVWHARQLD